MNIRYPTTPPPAMRDLAVTSFEEAVASRFESLYAVSVSSGTAALHCTLAALGIGPGDEVLVPAVSVIMSVVPVMYVGATPVFVDCQPESIDFDYQDLENNLTERTKAILPVHLWGRAYDMARLTQFARARGVFVIEDACQAHGTRWDDRLLGTWGTAGCFSMQDSKLISVGEGGFILTSDPEVAERCRGFRSHWTDHANPEMSYGRMGWNYRLSRVLAAIGNEQVQRFEQVLLERRRKGALLRHELRRIEELQPYTCSVREQPNDYQVVLLVPDRYIHWHLADELARRGIPNSVGTFRLKPVMDRGVFKSAESNWETPNARLFLARAISLIIHGDDTDDDLIQRAHKIAQIVREYRKG